MTLDNLYELTAEEFDLSDFCPTQETPEKWIVTASQRESMPSATKKNIVGRGVTEETALRDFRLQWVIAKYGDYRG